MEQAIQRPVSQMADGNYGLKEGGFASFKAKPKRCESGIS